MRYRPRWFTAKDVEYITGREIFKYPWPRPHVIYDGWVPVFVSKEKFYASDKRPDSADGEMYLKGRFPVDMKHPKYGVDEDGEPDGIILNMTGDLGHCPYGDFKLTESMKFYLTTVSFNDVGLEEIQGCHIHHFPTFLRPFERSYNGPFSSGVLTDSFDVSYIDQRLCYANFDVIRFCLTEGVLGWKQRIEELDAKKKEEQERKLYPPPVFNNYTPLGHPTAEVAQPNLETTQTDENESNISPSELNGALPAIQIYSESELVRVLQSLIAEFWSNPEEQPKNAAMESWLRQGEHGVDLKGRELSERDIKSLLSIARPYKYK